MPSTHNNKRKHKPSQSQKQHHHNKRRRAGPVITFDPEARSQYLQGFSERKRQRRAYGLAMQKVKDRKSKIEQRAETKRALKEQVEQAEQQKEELLAAVLQENHHGDDGDARISDQVVEEEPLDSVQTYQDVQTQSQWGGQVVVTTTTNIPGDSEDDEPIIKQHGKKRVDEAQEYAGNVEKFLSQLKGNMPGKKRKHNAHAPKHKGKHGASEMKGMARAGDLKLAQQVLAKSSHSGGKQKGGKARKKRR